MLTHKEKALSFLTASADARNFTHGRTRHQHHRHQGITTNVVSGIDKRIANTPRDRSTGAIEKNARIPTSDGPGLEKVGLGPGRAGVRRTIASGRRDCGLGPGPNPSLIATGRSAQTPKMASATRIPPPYFPPFFAPPAFFGEAKRIAN